MIPSNMSTIHQYVLDNDLLNEVENRTKRKWSVGSRTTYYNAVKKALDGETGRITLVEKLMLSEAECLMNERENIAA